MGAETLFAEMKRYVRFTDADAAELRNFGVVAEPHFADIAAQFYDRTREHLEAHAVFINESQIAGLQRSLVRWMQRLCDGPHDEAYFHERAKIGRMHVKIGLPQRYMFTGMSILRTAFQDLAAVMAVDRAPRVREALARILDLELAIMLETYNEDILARLTRIERADREQLERALARSEHRYARAVEQAHVLIVGLDAACVITLFNSEAERVSGYARDEVLGLRFDDLLLPAALRGAGGERLRRVAAGAGATDEVWEVPFLTRTGKERTVRWQLAHAPHPTDPDVVVFAIGQDITDERALLERSLQSEKLAAVGTLAAGLAHEIRNPLNGALLHVTFLERALSRQDAADEALEAARFIGTEIRRLSLLVKEFLVFARPSPLDLTPTSLRDVCERSLGVLADDAKAVQAELVRDFASTPVVVRLDPGKMEQVILNLVKNGIDAVGATGGGHVTVRTRRTPRHGVIEVEDDGPGLPSPDAPIFDAFFSTKAHGTGLGLAIVHRVITDHGGSVTFETRSGRTVFHVELPLTERGESKP